jgi:hypothetical protein
MNFQGHIEKGMVVLDHPLPLPDGTGVRVETVVPLSTDFWQSPSLDDLAQLQGVSGPRSFEDLLGGWPADELQDEFEATYVGWRQGELEQNQLAPFTPQT